MDIFNFQLVLQLCLNDLEKIKELNQKHKNNEFEICIDCIISHLYNSDLTVKNTELTDSIDKFEDIILDIRKNENYQNTELRDLIDSWKTVYGYLSKILDFQNNGFRELEYISEIFIVPSYEIKINDLILKANSSILVNVYGFYIEIDNKILSMNLSENQQLFDQLTRKT